MDLASWLLLFVFVLLQMLSTSTSYGREEPSFRVKAVNLGGWLVTEGWIKPSLFEGIPNRDLLDGTALQFRSVTTGKYLCAELGGGSILVANRTSASDWETLKLWRMDANHFQLRVFNKQFVGLVGTKAVAVKKTPTKAEIFEIVRESEHRSRVRIKASNGFFLQAKAEELVTADYAGTNGWQKTDPSIFFMNITATMLGEFQVTNGYGPQKAPQVMRKHWSSFIVEDDFKFIKRNGLNAVRIPVGWWIASDPTPPRPFVGGSLQALDNAFLWAQKYGLKVIIDLHAAPGSQNGWEHSASRDGSLAWGHTDANIKQTVDVIEFLTARYAQSPSLYAVELLNEPISLVPLETLTKYYKAGFEAVRKHSSTAFVLFCNRLGPIKPRELFPLASSLKGSAIDVHYYSLFSAALFGNMTVQQNIHYIYQNRTSDLHYLTSANGPRIFVGEWVAEWVVQGAAKTDYQRFAKAQLEVFGQATFGWSYWTLKNEQKHWNLKWMIENGYIKI